MRSLAITGIVLATLFAPATAFAAGDSEIGAPPVMMQGAAAAATAARPPMLPPAAALAGAPRVAMPAAPGAYQQPYYGYALPQYWVAPSYFIPNYRAYGLAAPAEGFGWSRYYDDAVLTDRWGRVYDWRGNVAWDRDRDRGRGWSADYGPDYHGERGDGMIGAGRPPRTGKAPKPPRGAPGGYSYEGRWTGSWDGGPVRTYEGRFDGDVRPHWQAWQGGYAAGPRLDYGAVPGYGGFGGAHGFSSYGYTVGGPVTVIIQSSAPVITKTVSYQTEWVRVAAAKRVATRAWRPKPKAKAAPRCVCR